VSRTGLAREQHPGAAPPFHELADQYVRQYAGLQQAIRPCKAVARACARLALLFKGRRVPCARLYACAALVDPQEPSATGCFADLC
jgi:hypothetical protein